MRRYLTAAQTAGVRITAIISDEEVRQVLLALHPTGGRPRGDAWARCVDQRATIERWLGDGLRLTKIRKLLVRHGEPRTRTENRELRTQNGAASSIAIDTPVGGG